MKLDKLKARLKAKRAEQTILIRQFNIVGKALNRTNTDIQQLQQRIKTHDYMAQTK